MGTISNHIDEFKELSTDAQKIVFEQVEKKYTLLLADDQTIRSRIQSVNAISIGLIVLLVSIIHNKDWEEYANNYFIALLIFLFYNGVIFFLAFTIKHKISNWDADLLITDNLKDLAESTCLTKIYFKRILYFENECFRLIENTKLIRLVFLISTICCGIAIAAFYYISYWV